MSAQTVSICEIMCLSEQCPSSGQRVHNLETVAHSTLSSCGMVYNPIMFPLTCIIFLWNNSMVLEQPTAFGKEHILLSIQVISYCT